MTLLVLPGRLKAQGNYAFDFKVTQKKTGTQSESQKGVTINNEKWCYNVIMENKSFKDIANLKIEYVVFLKMDDPGRSSIVGKSSLRHGPHAEVEVPVLKNNDRFTFATKEAQLVSSQLKAGYAWKSGAASTSRDALRGLWVRVFVDGKQVAEYTNPLELKNNQTWDPPAEEGHISGRKIQ